MHSFPVYLMVMAGITYLIRMLPLVLIKKKIQNRFLISFLYYIPYTVLAVMTVPAIFYATSSPVSAGFGFVVAISLALCKRSLLTVAALSSVAVFIAEWVMSII